MRRARSSRGAVAVEFALILPILLLLVFGIIEFGLAFKDNLTLASATRAGARTASASAKATDFKDVVGAAMSRAITGIDPDDIETLLVYKARPDGLPVSGTNSSCSDFCYRYVWDDTDKRFEASASPDWPGVEHDACARTAHSVGIYLQMKHEYLTGLFPGDLTLSNRTVMRFEPLPEYQGCAATA